MKKVFLALFVSMFMFACTNEQQTATQEEPTAEEAHEAEEEAAAAQSTFPADSVTEDGTMSFHGFRIDETGAMPVAQVSQVLEGQTGRVNTKLSGTVENVCQVKGCWMTLKMADEQTMRVRFKDYGFFVPKDGSGKQAIIEGDVFYDTTTVEVLRHYAVDGGMTEEEAAAKYTEPEIAVSFEATGVIIKDI
ncbi:MAG: DUF4920 domain-containing protein [Bacteroidota bacterium]